MMVNKFRKCVMDATAPLYKGIYDCAAINRISFDSHEDCYAKSGFSDITMIDWLTLRDACDFDVDDFILLVDQTTALRQVIESIVLYL